MQRKTFSILLVLFLLIFLVGLTLLALYRPQRLANQAFANVSPVRAVRVDYLNADNRWSEIAPLETRMQAAGVNLVAVGAGRVDWTYFPWQGHPDRWSEPVKTSGNDLLLEDSVRFGKWAHVSAVVDVLAPRYIQQHPEAAAISWLGTPSKNLVGTMELVDGQFGRDLLGMIEQIAGNYPVNSITLTELVYYIDGYGEQDKSAYLAYSGRSDWPRTAEGQINIDDPAIGVWRAYEIGRFLKQAASLVHAHGKQLFIEARLSVDEDGQVSARNGTDLTIFLEHADRIIIWGSSPPDEHAPRTLENLTQFLSRFGQDQTILMVGLWDKKYDYGIPNDQMLAIPTQDFQAALQSTVADGTANLWITPSFLMSASHWQVLDDFWGNLPNQ
jgi:hypothetical protein